MMITYNYFKILPFNEALDKHITESREDIYRDIEYMCMCETFGWDIQDWIACVRALERQHVITSVDNF